MKNLGSILLVSGLMFPAFSLIIDSLLGTTGNELCAFFLSLFCTMMLSQFGKKKESSPE